MAGEWQTRKIGDIGKVVTGKTPSTTRPENFDGDYPFITIPDLDGRRDIPMSARTLSELGAETMRSCRLPAGAVMMSCIATIGKCGITTRPSFTNQQINSVICGDDVDPKFLYYCFTQLGPALDAAGGGGSVYTNVSKSRFSAIEVALPPLKEQQAIANILGSLDDKIEMNRKMNRTLEAIAKAIFKSWFVDFDPVRAKVEGRNPGLPKNITDIFPNFFQDSELGEIPKGWNVSNLGDIAEVIDCLHSKKPERQASGKPLLQLWNIRDDSLIDMTDTYFITEDDYSQWISRMEAIPGDCVITNVGRVAATAQIPIGLNAALGRNMTGIRCRVSFLFPTFLIECLHSSAMKEEIAQKTDTGTILDALNVRNIPKLRIIKPSNNIASQFEFTCRPLRLKMERNFSISIQFTNLRDTLLPKMISGEFSIPDAARIIERVV
ncbi:MAG: restriction endonuclease subunit S [Syntrophales bacterium]|nr:restriction endonuclease subunit S [Syntrophales bacterium]